LFHRLKSRENRTTGCAVLNVLDSGPGFAPLIIQPLRDVALVSFATIYQ
jgi:hypothetical protein